MLFCWAAELLLVGWFSPMNLVARALHSGSVLTWTTTTPYEPSCLVPRSLQALGHGLGAKDSVIFWDLALTWNFHVFVGLSQTLILLQHNVFVV